MKFKIKFTDANAVEDAVSLAVDESIKPIYDNLDDDEIILLEDGRRDNLVNFLSEWIECHVAVTLEVDTDMGSIRVLLNEG